MFGVIGAGTMGAGIAVSLVVAGEHVVLIEPDTARREVALEDIGHSLERLAGKRDDLDVAQALRRVTLGTALAKTKGCAMVIEAVPESLELKRAIFADLDALHGPEVVLGSNTSSISISEIASGLSAPERVVGIHFFNPVPVSLLVEVVVGELTAANVVEAARSLADKLDKTPITVRDSPGFASSRLGVCIGLEGIRMVEEGVASPADIDAAMELGYRHPMGPLRLTDLVGLDVRLAIAEHLEAELGERFSPPALLREMVAQGKLGKKSGSGFYDW